MQPASYICGDYELKYCFGLLSQAGYLEIINLYLDDSFGFKITNKGHEFSNSFKNNNIRNKSRQVFIAMWFNESVNFLYDYFDSIIKHFGLNSLRIDNKIHNNKIDDGIKLEIKKSKFLIADLTGNRGSIYYEIGYAHALEIPVIITSNINDKDIPFDVRQYNCIF
jgi:hypothetical protein